MNKEFISFAGIGFLCGTAIVGLNAMKRQTLTIAIPPNTAFQIAFDDDDSDVNYRWWCDGAIIKNFSSAEITAGKSGTTFTLSVPGMIAGKHSCLISAFNSLGETKSDPIDVPIGNLPVKPNSLKIIVK